MEHIFWIYENEVAGRPGPGVAPWRLRDLKAGGFDAMLSVASDLFRHTEASEVGLSRACIPFPDVVPPDVNVSQLCAASLPMTFDFIHANVENGRKVLVHCAGGNDRTGLVLCYYMARREDIDAKTALARIRKIRPNALSAVGWENMALSLLPKLLERNRGTNAR